MKITFSNLGAIKKTTLDLRPLTVIIGQNNYNKTYIAYSIYGLCKTYEENLEVETSFPKDLKIFKKTPNSIVFKLDDNFLKTFSEKFDEEAREFKLELGNFFQDSTRKIFSRTKLEVQITKSELYIALRLLTADIVSSAFGIKFDISKEWLSATVIEEKDYGLEENFESFEEEVIGIIDFFLRIGVFRHPFLLPAERNAFIITYKMLANRRYKLLKQTQREIFRHRVNERQFELLKEQGDIRYPQPIEDFLDFLTDIELQTNQVSVSEETINFHELADKIEENIQNKNTTSFKSTKLGGNEIKINIKKGIDIDLYNASSSIKQLAPLLLYLRYKAGPNNFLIIDEPEMNLHPESQAKLLEVLAMLVNAGVKVLLTTHSPYFMSHLNNLISGDMENEEVRETQAKSLYLQDVRAFLKPEDVSAYEMRKDKTGKHQELHDLHDKDYGIRWDTLSDVSADIQQKYFEIYEKTKETSSDGEEE